MKLLTLLFFMSSIFVLANVTTVQSVEEAGPEEEPQYRFDLVRKLLKGVVNVVTLPDPEEQRQGQGQGQGLGGPVQTVQIGRWPND